MTKFVTEGKKDKETHDLEILQNFGVKKREEKRETQLMSEKARVKTREGEREKRERKERLNFET